MRSVTKSVFGQGFDEVMKHLDSNGDGKVNTLDEVRTLIFGDAGPYPLDLDHLNIYIYIICG